MLAFWNRLGTGSGIVWRAGEVREAQREEIKISRNEGGGRVKRPVFQGLRGNQRGMRDEGGMRESSCREEDKGRRDCRNVASRAGFRCPRRWLYPLFGSANHLRLSLENPLGTPPADE